MERHFYNVIIEMCVAVCAGIWAYVAALLSWLVIDIYSAIWYIISRKRGKTMHKENIFDLFNKQNPSPAEDPAPVDVVKAEDVKPDIVEPEDGAKDKPENVEPENETPAAEEKEKAEKAERSEDA